jgi:hypothetical protein
MGRLPIKDDGATWRQRGERALEIRQLHSQLMSTIWEVADID